MGIEKDDQIRGCAALRRGVAQTRSVGAQLRIVCIPAPGRTNNSSPSPVPREREKTVGYLPRNNLQRARAIIPAETPTTMVAVP